MKKVFSPSLKVKLPFYGLELRSRAAAKHAV
jgi:hypothetical protein